jgi:hypothetical protein
MVKKGIILQLKSRENILNVSSLVGTVRMFASKKIKKVCDGIDVVKSEVNNLDNIEIKD